MKIVDASFVDMESASWALEARRLDLPWAVLRIISDSPERPLTWLTEMLDG
jgi:nucleoside phosphorylase